jgi:hypothetical protein
VVTRISIFDSTYVQAAVLAVRAANKELQAEIRKHTDAEITPDWQEVMLGHASTSAEVIGLAQTARVAVSNQTVRISSATVNAKFSGGLDVKTEGAALEFGADRNVESTFTQRSRRGKPYKRTSRTRRQLRPVNSKGYVFYPSVASVIPRYASLWVQTCMKTIGDALDSAGKK